MCLLPLKAWAECASAEYAYSVVGCGGKPVLGNHTEQLLKLPLIHKDPFDRMLVAQSMAEPLVLLTNDSVLAQYWDGVRLV